MTIKVTLEFDTIEDAIVDLGKLLEEGQTVKTVSPGSAETGAKDATRQVNKLAPTKKVQELMDQHKLTVEDVKGTGKDGRITQADVKNHLNKIASQSSGSDDESGETPETPPETETSGSVEDCKTALKGLNDTKGMQVCIDVLSRFGAKRISDLKEGQYPDFIAKCEAVKNGEDV